MRFTGYPEWHPDFASRLNVKIDFEGVEEDNFSTGVVETSHSGRVRVVIEGERALVNEMLGKNWLKRARRMRKKKSI